MQTGSYRCQGVSMKMAFRRGGIFALQADKVGRLERDPDQTESLLLEVSLPKRWYLRRL